MSKKQHAIEQDAKGFCIVCGVETPNRKRGLCVTDYNRFRSALAQVAPEERSRFEHLLIEDGRLLASRQGQRGGLEDDVFAEALVKFRSSSSPLTPAEEQAHIDALTKIASEEENHTQAPKEPVPRKKRKRRRTK